MDLKKQQFKTELAGKPLLLEVSRLADQANASVLGTCGETTVLATVVMGSKDREGVDYFPLTVNYEEKYYAVGKILGGRFMKREGRSSDEAVLSGRIIDRTLRPLFNQSIRREVQVVVTILSFDGENDPDFIGLLSASTALSISSIPWDGPVAGLRISKLKDGEYLINPQISELKDKSLEFDSFVAGTKTRINMIELEGHEAQEKSVVGAFEIAQKEVSKLVAFQEDIVKKIGKEKEKVAIAEPNKEMAAEIKKFLKGKLEEAVYQPSKGEMKGKSAELLEKLKATLTEKKYSEEDVAASENVFHEEINNLIHEKILKEEKRPDGRKLNEVRELHTEVGLLKRLHGSALFIRGNTQSLAVTTLGAPGDQQLLETIEFSGKRRFLLHYNFPPYSTGEVKPIRGPGRREIGHGALAEKALRNLLPSQEEFPYTIRLVSEILSSNGSSSMATVCAGSLSLMDAGVPVKKPAAGIAMGLILDEKGKEYKILTDIQGPEDHHGDMDFKVAGTDSGVTAIQMDVKVQGLTVEILEKALEQAKEARLHILKNMTATLSAPRQNLSPFAPRIIRLTINPELIGALIGPGGKIINGIIEDTGANAIDIEDDGQVFITAPNEEVAKKTLEQVQAITKEYAIGDIIEGEVVKILEFGAIVEFAPGKDGMIHVSELKNGFVKKVEDVVKMGDFVRAKIIKVENGKIGLSIKQLNK